MSRQVLLVLLFVPQGAPAPTQNAAQNPNSVSPVEFVIDPPTLINVTDGFSGGAPDLGALEVGAAVPRYGPRP